MLEGSAISYVFDQSPVSEDSLGWDSFVSKLSRETVFSDNKLKAILRNMAKAEAKLLGLAINAIKSALESGGQFSVIQGQASQDECGDVFINFIVHLKEDNKKIKLGVKIENAKPLLVFPEEAREILNSLGTEGGKLLRAEIMHCQETVLDNMDDVVKIVHKRNEYLRNLENKIDNIVSNMGPLQVALIKNILKSKYKGVR